MLMLQTPRGGGAVAGRGFGMRLGRRQAKEEVRGLPFRDMPMLDQGFPLICFLVRPVLCGSMRRNRASTKSSSA